VDPVQRGLFSHGSNVSHFAGVANDWERSGREAIEWQRDEAATTEKLHDVPRNPRGGGDAVRVV
jgi:hypothetical protein